MIGIHSDVSDRSRDPLYSISAAHLFVSLLHAPMMLMMPQITMGVRTINGLE